jgi:glycosyltransferase involved in cell wall biosynthesis
MKKTKIHIDGGFFTTSGYSTALRKFSEELITRPDVEVTLTNINFKNDKPIQWDSPLVKHIAPVPEDADFQLMWAVPETRSLYHQPQSGLRLASGVAKGHYFTWEADRMPRVWENILRAAELDAIFTPSHFCKDLIYTDFKEDAVPIEVIPHGYEPTNYYPLTDIEKENTFVVLFVGTWIPRKSPLETILNTCNALVDSGAELWIKVDYDDETIASILNNIKSHLVKTLNVDASRLPKIKILNGTFTMEQMNVMYNKASITVLMSHGEGWGLPLFHSICAGTPVITTDTGGQMDFLGLDYPFLVDVNGYEPTHGEAYLAPQFGHLWHTVNWEQYREKLVEAYKNYITLPSVAVQAFNELKHYTWAYAVDNFLNQVHDIIDK